MNVGNNHLVRLEAGSAVPAGYEVVPAHLEYASEAVLRGQQQATVSRHSGGKLSKWAACRRKERRRMAKESRRRNRSA